MPFAPLCSQSVPDTFSPFREWRDELLNNHLPTKLFDVMGRGLGEQGLNISLPSPVSGPS
jgi:hypothetical protein